MRRVRLAGLAAGVAALVAAEVADAPALEYHGYLRSGIGASDRGGSQVCFKLPGASSKYRLGNECETYGELELDETVFKSQDGRAQFALHTMFAYISSQRREFELLDGEDNNQWALRQAWGEATGVFGGGALKDARAWVGKRYYLRNDVHITDFYYWNNSGPGAGLENINLGFGKLHYALRQDKERPLSDLTPGQGDASLFSNDLRLSDLKVNPGGSLTVGVDIRTATGAGSAVRDGWSVHLQHLQSEFLGGFNKVAVQYGEDAGAGLGDTLTLSIPPDGDTLTTESQSRWRVVEQIVIQPSPQLSGQFTVVYQSSENDATGVEEDWFSIGGRPVWHLSQYFNVALEYGYDQVDPKNGGTRTLQKVSLAPQIAAGRSFFSRPLIRLFATYAWWDRDASDAGLGDHTPFAGRTDGFSYGAQFEAWW